MSQESTTALDEKKEKNLFWFVRVANALPSWRDYMKAERHQYRTDVKALQCRGNLSEKELQRVQMSLNLEWAVFGLSRALVPFSLFIMYRRGVFQESFHFEELKAIVKIAMAMHAVDLGGHLMMRVLTNAIVEEHVGVNEDSFAFKKKTVDDYLVQKNYFKSKKENKL